MEYIRSNTYLFKGNGDAEKVGDSFPFEFLGRFKVGGGELLLEVVPEGHGRMVRW